MTTGHRYQTVSDLASAKVSYHSTADKGQDAKEGPIITMMENDALYHYESQKGGL